MEENDTIDPNLFFHLFSQLRSQNAANINESSEKLEELYSIPNSVPSLLILAESADDPILQQYALYGINVCLRKIGRNLSSSILSGCRTKIVQMLTVDINQDVRRAAIDVITVILTIWKGIWPELNDFLFGQSSDLGSVLQILSHLVFTLDGFQVIKSLDLFQQYILAGLKSDSINVVADAVSFLFTLASNLRDRSSFNIFSEPLIAVLSEVAPSGNSSDLMLIVTPIMRGFEAGVNIIPFTEIFPAFVGLLQQKSLDIEYRLRLHSFLASTLTYNKTVDFEEPDLLTLLDLELAISCEFFALEDIDPTLNWLYDIDLMFHELFYRMEQESVIEYTIKRIEDLPKASVLLLIDNSMDCAEDEALAKLEDFFQIILDCLGDNSPIVVRMAVRTLESKQSLFEEEINGHLLDIVPAVVSFMRSEDPISGSVLLTSLVWKSDDTDPIFESLISVSQEMMQNVDPSIRFGGAKVFSGLCLKSGILIETNYEEIYKSLSGKESTEFDIFSSLCLRLPEEMNSKVKEYLPIVIQSLSSKEIHEKIDAIECVDRIAIPMKESIQPFMKEIFDALLKISDRQWSPQLTKSIQSGDSYESEWKMRKFSAACSALEALSKYAMLSNDGPHVLASFRVVITFAGTIWTNGIVSSLKSFALLVQAIPNLNTVDEDTVSYTRMMVAQCFKLLDTSSDPETIVSCISSLNSAIKSCGVSVLDGHEGPFVQILMRLISEKVNIHTHEYFFDEIVHDPSLYPAPIIAASAIGGDGEVLKEVLPLLSELMKAKSQRFNCFSVDIISKLLCGAGSYLAPDFKQSFEEKCLDFVENGPPKVAVAACNHFLSMCDFAETEAIIQISQKRLLSTQSDRNFLKEHLIGIISTFSIKSGGPPKCFDMSAFLQAMPVLRCFPFTPAIYQFFYLLGSQLDRENSAGFARACVLLFARPQDQIRGLVGSDEAAFSLFSLLKKCEPMRQNFDSEMGEILSSDERRIQIFRETAALFEARNDT